MKNWKNWKEHQERIFGPLMPYSGALKRALLQLTLEPFVA